MPFITILIFGALASCFALIFEFIFLSPVASIYQPFTLTLATTLSLLALACIEEVSKYLFLRQYAIRFSKDTVITSQKIFLFSIFFGIGFSLLEIFLSSQNGITTPFLPMFGRTLLHIGTSFILASFIFPPSKTSFSRKTLWLILAVTFIHFFYNLVSLVAI